jgi:hypothetical protein
VIEKGKNMAEITMITIFFYLNVAALPFLLLITRDNIRKKEWKRVIVGTVVLIFEIPWITAAALVIF